MSLTMARSERAQNILTHANFLNSIKSESETVSIVWKLKLN